MSSTRDDKSVPPKYGLSATLSVGQGQTPRLAVGEGYPRLVSKVDPAYTEQARRTGLGGTVLLRTVIDCEMHGISRGLRSRRGSFVLGVAPGGARCPFKNWRRDRISNPFECRLQIHSQGGHQKPAQLDGPDAKLKIALISDLRRAAHAAAVSHQLEHLRVWGLIMLICILEKNAIT
jgi:hypothetical protein